MAGRDGKAFDCAAWTHRAEKVSTEKFKRKVKHHIRGKETEPWKIL
jgi:hypothetical protein